jgi:hypothetical protein
MAIVRTEIAVSIQVQAHVIQQKFFFGQNRLSDRDGNGA